MAADGLVTQGARAPADLVLIMCDKLAHVMTTNICFYFSLNNSAHNELTVKQLRDEMDHQRAPAKTCGQKGIRLDAVGGEQLISNIRICPSLFLILDTRTWPPQPL